MVFWYQTLIFNAAKQNPVSLQQVRPSPKALPGPPMGRPVGRVVPLALILRLAAYALWTASQWKRGKDYLNNSGRTWKNLIRATRTETTTFQVYEYICQPDVYIPWDEDYYAADADCWEWRTRTISTYIMEPSDGLLHRSTQEGARAANWNPTPVEARGVNHLEMGTHVRVETILREIWSGLHGGANSARFIIQPK